MKNLLVTIAALMISGFATAQSPAIEGNWGIQVVQNGFVFDTTFSISHDSITVTNVCSSNGATASAHVTAASSYNDSTLTIHESRQDQQSNQGLNCNVGVQQDSMRYTVQGNQLIFTHDGSPQSFVLTRK
jgi:hypothetical protein